ncbi:MAG: hypothetical protein ING84_16680 [Cytophagales bacterium]|nr:hypothetical protein [Cytophagales bacterium]MCA6369478.1 hypothetical protein [Cytophagales bacterium]MCA6373206.1 hypothetical protein [Cytophagales bacterium]MCA6376367.1 hypothetical protein [Cytophagales bacterium]MCA6383614.1 hypothetical protein [Cytophagales bacterium]
MIDKETREPLPFASVGIPGKPISTITNLQGEFDFQSLDEAVGKARFNRTKKHFAYSYSHYFFLGLIS